MADRIMAGLILLVSVGYTIIAFTVIKAPFQYDPLGPETWPRILGVLSCLCALWVFFRPDVDDMDVNRRTWTRLAGLVVLLLGYAWAFQPAGFVISTFGFCVLLSTMLGAGIVQSVIFSAVTGIAGYAVATLLLDLNLPAGLLAFME